MVSLHPEELAAAKAYMRIEGDEEDSLVVSMVMAARAYLEGAGVSLPPAGSDRRSIYDLACHGLALSYYDHREETGTALADNPALRRAINQLKYTEPPASNLGDGGAGGEGDHGEECDGGGAADPDSGIPPGKGSG